MRTTSELVMLSRDLLPWQILPDVNEQCRGAERCRAGERGRGKGGEGGAEGDRSVGQQRLVGIMAEVCEREQDASSQDKVLDDRWPCRVLAPRSDVTFCRSPHGYRELWSAGHYDDERKAEELHLSQGDMQ